MVSGYLFEIVCKSLDSVNELPKFKDWAYCNWRYFLIITFIGYFMDVLSVQFPSCLTYIYAQFQLQYFTDTNALSFISLFRYSFQDQLH